MIPLWDDNSQEHTKPYVMASDWVAYEKPMMNLPLSGKSVRDRHKDIAYDAVRWAIIQAAVEEDVGAKPCSGHRYEISSGPRRARLIRR